MRIDAISVGHHPPEDVNVIVEVSVGSQPIEYELDKKSGALVIESILNTPMSYPGNFGFVPHTLSLYKKPLNVLIASTRPLLAGCVINVRPIGALFLKEHGGEDAKVIAVPVPNVTRRYDTIRNYTDLSAVTSEQIEHFFLHYKDLAPRNCGKTVDWQDVSVAKEMILDAIARFKAKP
ncbi:inorganic diphosphatase [Hoeflea sp. EC-HK425]|uniref:inorganic diphosphatase n=1 Tax=Hoeflea sp. EC-HK425 TaxID=2038388 RepID=UPI00125BE04C|nr:inorganic diphosphatase [Hoeflea sp. EC-HK425]VVT35204.1 Inorganic pyrophosphatase [Hoeflea sp. EC-HK425]